MSLKTKDKESYFEGKTPDLVKRACEECSHSGIDIKKSTRHCVICITHPGKKKWKQGRISKKLQNKVALKVVKQKLF